MNDDAAILGAAQRLYAASSVGDWDTAEKELHDDLVIHEAASLPYGGSYHGRSALRELYATVTTHWPNVELTRHGMSVGDGRVVVFFTLVIDTPEGRHAHEIVEINEFRDGKVAVMKPFYWDTAALKALALKLESKA